MNCERPEKIFLNTCSKTIDIVVQSGGAKQKIRRR